MYSAEEVEIVLVTTPLTFILADNATHSDICGIFLDWHQFVLDIIIFVKKKNYLKYFLLIIILPKELSICLQKIIMNSQLSIWITLVPLCFWNQIISFKASSLYIFFYISLYLLLSQLLYDLFNRSYFLYFINFLYSISCEVFSN